MPAILINGRIFEFPITGVGRFCYEVISEMDKMVDPGEILLAVPRDAKNIPELSNIEVRTIGKHTGIYWEQIELPIFVKNNNCKCISMSSSVPLLTPDYVLIHDISLKVNRDKNGDLKDKMKIWWPLLQYKIGIKKSEVLFTDTYFQKTEFEREYKTNREIIVAYAGWQHMDRISCDDNIIKKLGLENKEYLFAVSTRAKNKNFKWILKVAEQHSDILFVIAGKLDTKYFSDATELDSLPNIVATGYVSDSQMKSLMKNAKAFLYPSIYEGFGIPPLEAMSVGTKAIVAKSSCLPEVYEDTVYYIDPYNYNIDFDALLNQNVEKAEKVLKKYSWEKTARVILDAIDY